MFSDFSRAITGFPKLLVDRYPLDTDTVAGLHVPAKCCEISLKQGGPTSSLLRGTFRNCSSLGPQPGRYCSKSWCPLKKKKKRSSL